MLTGRFTIPLLSFAQLQAARAALNDKTEIALFDGLYTVVQISWDFHCAHGNAQLVPLVRIREGAV
ncbi:hypothetical protein [Caballeronia sp. dw_19]|uniref:hypothetical protein n=1 Tax=Caballeronia sp. dw_19 TaxID=2719791 RepID=UPI001BCD626D|nr:hypothetical protein [Caballeronia sp. dw_19]